MLNACNDAGLILRGLSHPNSVTWTAKLNPTKAQCVHSNSS